MILGLEPSMAIASLTHVPFRNRAWQAKLD